MVVQSPVVQDETGRSVAAQPVWQVVTDESGVTAAIAYTDAAGYPEGATVLQPSSGNLAATSAAVTLPGVANEMVYLTGFDLTFAGATAESNVLLTISGLEGSDRLYVVSVPAGATKPGEPLFVSFNPPLPAEGLNTSIVLNLPSLGEGNTHAVVNAQGYRV